MNDKVKEVLEMSFGWLLFVGFIAVVIFIISHLQKVTPDATTPTSKPSTYFASCADARAAGRENIPQDDPAYRPELDRDGDGLACEPYTP